MKRVFSIVIVAAALFAIPSCKEVVETDRPQMQALSDSIFHTYNTVGSVYIVPDDRSHLKVVLGDAQLYKAGDDKKKMVAEEIGRMAIFIFGKDNYLHDGKLIITKDLKNHSGEPADGIAVPIDITGLKKQNGG